MLMNALRARTTHATDPERARTTFSEDPEVRAEAIRDAAESLALFAPVTAQVMAHRLSALLQEMHETHERQRRGY